MKTRYTLTRLAIALSIALFLPPRSSVAAEEPGTLPFLKVGSTYHLTSSAELPRTVKILEFAGGQWFHVEYYNIRTLGTPGRDVTRPTSDQKPLEMWINFANVAGIKESKEPDKKEPEKK